MLKRPKPGEDEDDILQMQEEYLREKNKNENLRPAAQVTNLRHFEPQIKRPNVEGPSSRKPSKYAQAKGLKNEEKCVRFESSTGSVMGDILEKNVEEQQVELDEDDKVYYPKVLPSVMGGIVEKNTDNFKDFNFKPMPAQGFPVATKRDFGVRPSKKSMHSQQFKKLKQNEKSVEMEVDEPSFKVMEHTKINDISKNLPSKSFILSSEEANVIHEENVSILSKMSEQEILQEQQKLISNLDPNLVNWLKSKRKTSAGNANAATKLHEEVTTEENMDVSDSISKNDVTEDSMWDNDVLSHQNINEWLHFDSLEKDKLEWIKGIEESKKIKPDEQYEARFDFKGYLLPYTMDYTEQTKTLFHHGEEPHRPGYTLTELFELSRSTITQQRVVALNTLAGVLEYYSAGTYKNIIEIPLSKIFFVVRIAMDENKVIILEPALKTMRNLLYNRIDEASLDALIGFEEGSQQPCLENDKSEIEELESKESELKDFHLAEIDLISALLRTDILQRLYYILDIVKPSFNCVQYAIQILTRLARDSIETATKIAQSDHLMRTIIKNFVPTTSINFMFDPQIVYNGKPVLAALKFLRILALQCKEIGDMLVTKYDVMAPISEYISSGVDGTYGLRIQIEAFCILSNLLHYHIGVENALSLCPVIITALYKHVQGTDVFLESSILSATHAAVVLQFVNKLLSCKHLNLDTCKQQIYPLLKEGVQKWLGQLSQSKAYTCGHLRLVCSALDCCKTILLLEKVEVKFLNDSLIKLATSQGFQTIVSNLEQSSNLISGIETKDLHFTKNLMSLGSSAIDSAQKILPVLNVVSPIPFLASLLKLLEVVNDTNISRPFIEKLEQYTEKLTQKVPSLCDNWFTRLETDMLFSIVKLSMQLDIPESKKDLLYSVANKLCYILRIDKRDELEFLFNSIVFDKQWFTAVRLMNLVSVSDADGFSKALTSIEEIKLCYNRVINLGYRDTGPNVVLRKWQEPILPRDWIYLPILNLYSRSQEPQAPRIIGQEVTETPAQTAAKEFIIRCSLEWILFNELCFPDLLNDINVTDRFCRIMCVFLCDNSLFLDAKIKLLLQKCTQILFKKRGAFDFDQQLTGLHNFQDFYTQFLEQFQSVSYGDHTFAACVLVPLAQKHNVKWRKLIWSEYAGCLRALDCPEASLCYELHEYLHPEETDESLMTSYFRALSTNLLRPDTIAHKIASHHVKKFKERTNL